MLFIKKYGFKILKIYMIFSIIAIILFSIFDPETKTLLVVTSNNCSEIKVTKDDPRVKDIWENGKDFILNNSNNILYLESVSYSSHRSFNYNSNKIEVFSGVTPVGFHINYVFKTPPESIRVKSNESTEKWYLHR